MPRKTAPKFVALDGTEFASKEEAKRYEKLLEAKDAYEQARLKFAQALWETQKTADGENFVLERPWHYFYINDLWGMPELETVSFYIRNCNLREDNEIEIILWEPDQRRYRTFKISELYVDKQKAKEALVEKSEKYLLEMTNYVNKLKNS